MKKNKIALIIFFLLLSVALRLPSLFEPYWHGDEGITLTVGQQLSRGAVLYKDITDNKTPFLYFLASKAVNLFNFKLLTLFWVVLTVFFFFKLTEILTEERKVLALLVFVFLTATPFWEANIVNGEIYGILPMIISAYLFWQKSYFFSGILACFAFLFKHPFVFDFLSFLTFLVLFNPNKEKHLVLNLIKLGTGFLMPFLAILIYFSQQKALKDFFKQAFISNFQYVGWQSDFFIPQGLIIFKALILLLVALFIYQRRTKLSGEKIFIGLWLIFSLFGATISARPYPHYLLQTVPAFSLIIACSWQTIKILLISLIVIVSIFQFKINSRTLIYVFRYYQTFLGGNFNQFFGQEVKITYQLADFLKQNTAGNEPVFVFSDNSLIYALSQRKPANRYIAAYHIKADPAREKETINSLLKTKPKFIIITLPMKYLLPGLADVLKNEYTLIKENEDYQIYQRKI